MHGVGQGNTGRLASKVGPWGMHGNLWLHKGQAQVCTGVVAPRKSRKVACHGPALGTRRQHMHSHRKEGSNPRKNMILFVLPRDRAREEDPAEDSEEDIPRVEIQLPPQPDVGGSARRPCEVLTNFLELDTFPSHRRVRIDYFPNYACKRMKQQKKKLYRRRRRRMTAALPPLPTAPIRRGIRSV